MHLLLRAFFQGYDFSEQRRPLRPGQKNELIEIFLIGSMINVNAYICMSEVNLDVRMRFTVIL